MSTRKCDHWVAVNSFTARPCGNKPLENGYCARHQPKPAELVSLTEGLGATLLDLLAHNAYMLQSTALAATKSPDGRIAYERIFNPQIGDLVMEVTAGAISLIRGEFNKQAIGYLRSDPNVDPVEIEGLDGVMCDWSNARFIACATPELHADIREQQRRDLKRRADSLQRTMESHGL